MSRSARNCNAVDGCHPDVAPTRPKGKSGWPVNYLDCRHYSCPDGREAAANAVANGRLGVVTVILRDDDGTDVEMNVLAANFGTNEKPPGTRVVEKETGLIFSLQGKEWYATG